MIDTNTSGKMENYKIETFLRGFGKNEDEINKWFKTHGGREKMYFIDDFVRLIVSKK